MGPAVEVITELRKAPPIRRRSRMRQVMHYVRVASSQSTQRRFAARSLPPWWVSVSFAALEAVAAGASISGSSSGPGIQPAQSPAGPVNAIKPAHQSPVVFS